MGYRRLCAYLRFVDQREVNKKRILRLMLQHPLLVPPHLRLKAKRATSGSNPRPTTPHQWWGIDMTNVLVEGFGWVYIVVVLDWYTKVIVGYYAGVRCTSQDGLSALDGALSGQFPAGVRGQELSLMSDNGCQPTSTAFMQTCGTLGLQQAFTSYNNPKGNADTERVLRPLKEECVWLQEWTCPHELFAALDAWIADYNEHFLHSALGYKPPRQFARESHNRHRTAFVAA